MNYRNKMNKLADFFEIKLAQQVQTSQWDTNSLFFKKDGQSDQQSEMNQRAFAAAAQNPSGPIYKILEKYWQSNNAQTVSFSASITANPGRGAAFIVNVKPEGIKSQIIKALDQIYQSIMGQSISARQSFADQKAKTQSAGSGTLPLAELILE